MNKIYGRVVGATTPPIDSYTKDETKALLDKKANKSDIASVYRFRGSVDKFDDLPTEYTFEVCDAPYIMQNGVKKVIGTYHSGTGIVTFNYDLQPQSSAVIIIPVEVKTIKSGYYALAKMDFDSGFNIPDEDEVYVERYIGERLGNNVTSFYCSGSPFAYYENEREISGLYLYCYNESDELVSIGGTGGVACSVQSVLYKGFLEHHEALTLGDVYNVLDTGMNVAWTGTEWDSLGGSGRDDEARADIDKLETEMKNKANKEDIVSAYKFCGSIDTFDEELMTPATYEIIPTGNPTYNGEVVGTFDAESRTVTIDSNKLEGWEGYEVKVQIEPITISKGYYSFDNEVGILNERGNVLVNGYFYSEGCVWKIEDTITISEVCIGTQGYSYSGTHSLGRLFKDSSVQVEETYMCATGFQVIRNLTAGDVYNAIDTGMNYAWTGTEWDALGGEHKDLEAREQIGDIETALDSIIEIQNSLIGGDA